MSDQRNGDDFEERKKIEEFLNNLKSAKDSLSKYMDIREQYQNDLLEDIKLVVLDLKREGKIVASKDTNEEELWESIMNISLSMWDQTEMVVSQYFNDPDLPIKSSSVFSSFDKENEVLLKIHSINKENILLQFPEIVDLDSNGFIELENTIQLDSVGMYDAIFEEGGFTEPFD